jgi:hypothetical protein
LCNFLHSPVTSSLLGSNILLRTLFSNTLSLCSSLSVRDQVYYRVFKNVEHFMDIHHFNHFPRFLFCTIFMLVIKQVFSILRFISVMFCIANMFCITCRETRSVCPKYNLL